MNRPDGHFSYCIVNISTNIRNRLAPATLHNRIEGCVTKRQSVLIQCHTVILKQFEVKYP